MAESLKVDARAFKAAIRALVNAKPERIIDISCKRQAEAKKPGPKKRRH